MDRNIAFTHYYEREAPRFIVKTNKSNEELKEIIIVTSFYQSLFPYFQSVDDDLVTDELYYVLEKSFGFELIEISENDLLETIEINNITVFNIYVVRESLGRPPYPKYDEQELFKKYEKNKIWLHLLEGIYQIYFKDRNAEIQRYKEDIELINKIKNAILNNDETVKWNSWETNETVSCSNFNKCKDMKDIREIYENYVSKNTAYKIKDVYLKYKRSKEVRTSLESTIMTCIASKKRKDLEKEFPEFATFNPKEYKPTKKIFSKFIKEGISFILDEKNINKIKLKINTTHKVPINFWNRKFVCIESDVSDYKFYICVEKKLIYELYTKPLEKEGREPYIEDDVLDIFAEVMQYPQICKKYFKYNLILNQTGFIKNNQFNRIFKNNNKSKNNFFRYEVILKNKKYYVTFSYTKSLSL